VRQVTLGVVVLGLVWRAVRYAMAFPLWGDEAFLAVNFLTRDLAGLGRPLEFKQVAPPAFLWAEYALVRGLGGSEWSLRLVPFLAGVASLGLFWRFCREVATRRVTLVAVALFAASFYPVRQLMLYMAPAFCLLAGEGIVALLRAGRGLRRGPVVAAGLLALFPVIGMVCDVRMP
jgi:4-amino-4-deoxy-L-arabinose transferase-like glycosyltransferase